MKPDWFFQFPFYRSECSRDWNGMRHTITKKLDPITYWCIRLIHGQNKLTKLSASAYLDKGGIPS
jgi:hypothetical protein